MNDIAPAVKTATVETAACRVAMSRVMWAADAKSRTPILRTVLVQAQAGGVNPVCTDMDTRATISVDADSRSEWATCVNAKMFADALKTAGDTVTLVADKGVLRVGACTILTFPADDFPKWHKKACEPVARLTLDANAWRAIVRKVGFAISAEPARYYLCGVLLQNDNGTMRAVATDGHRMGVMAVECSHDQRWPESTALCSIHTLPRLALLGA